MEKNGVSEKDVLGLINEKFKELYESLESLWSSIEGAIEISHGSLESRLEILDFKIDALLAEHNIEVDYEEILKRSKSIKDRVEKLFKEIEKRYEKNSYNFMSDLSSMDCKGNRNTKSV